MTLQFFTGLYVGIGSSWLFATIIGGLAYFLRQRSVEASSEEIYRRGVLAGKLELQREQYQAEELRKLERFHELEQARIRREAREADPLKTCDKSFGPGGDGAPDTIPPENSH